MNETEELPPWFGALSENILELIGSKFAESSLPSLVEDILQTMF